MKSNDHVIPPSEPGTGLASRRRDVRFAPPPNLRVSIQGCRSALTILDISLGGVGLATSAPLGRGIYGVTLTLGSSEFQRRAEVIYCRKKSAGRWIIGMSFIEEPTTGPTIESLIDTITATLIKFS
jgi:PilZ domain